MGPKTAQQVARKYAFAATLLRAAAVLTVVLALFVNFAKAYAVARGPSAAEWGSWAEPAAWLFAALVAGSVLLGLAAAIDLLRAMVLAGTSMSASAAADQPAFSETTVEDHSSGAARGPTNGHSKRSPTGNDATGEVAWSEMMELLRDMRDNTLLSESERAEKRRRVAEEDMARARQSIADLLHGGQFIRARRVVEEMRRRYPDRTDVEKLAAEVEAARARAESQDVATYTKRTEELMTISAWERAREVARELLERHPNNSSAQNLVERVSRERELFQGEQRRRMHAEIERYVSRRRWRDALAAAKTFVDHFAGSNDSETLKAQMPTLQANAEIEERQELEAQITDLAKHARYIEAYNLARHLCERYPTSPQAEALRGQLARLKELAHDPNAPPARVKVES